jgi:hypothetical protein
MWKGRLWSWWPWRLKTTRPPQIRLNKHHLKVRRHLFKRYLISTSVGELENIPSRVGYALCTYSCGTVSFRRLFEEKPFVNKYSCLDACKSTAVHVYCTSMYT